MRRRASLVKRKVGCCLAQDGVCICLHQLCYKRHTSFVAQLVAALASSPDKDKVLLDAEAPFALVVVQLAAACTAAGVPDVCGARIEDDHEPVLENKVGQGYLLSCCCDCERSPVASNARWALAPGGDSMVLERALIKEGVLGLISVPVPLAEVYKELFHLLVSLLNSSWLFGHQLETSGGGLLRIFRRDPLLRQDVRRKDTMKVRQRLGEAGDGHQR